MSEERILLDYLNDTLNLHYLQTIEEDLKPLEVVVQSIVDDLFNK